MPTYKNIDSFFDEKGPEDIERFVDKNLDISQQVYALLREKGWSQKELALKMEKTEAEISKWLSGLHNLTLKSITKMEAVLGMDIILTPLKAAAILPSQIKYITVQVEAPLPYHLTPDLLAKSPLPYHFRTDLLPQYKISPSEQTEDYQLAIAA